MLAFLSGTFTHLHIDLEATKYYFHRWCWVGPGWKKGQIGPSLVQWWRLARILAWCGLKGSSRSLALVRERVGIACSGDSLAQTFSPFVLETSGLLLAQASSQIHVGEV
jgi:hypothetical protein